MEALEEQSDLIAKNLSKVSVSVVDDKGSAEINMPITNLKDINGNIVSTNTNGVANGYVTSGSVTLSISGYTDITSASVSFSAEKGKFYAVRITVSRNNFKSITSTTNLKFSTKVTRVTYSLVGGGGGGGGYAYDSRSNGYMYGGGGGGGGYGINGSFTPDPHQSYPVSIGAGGGIITAIDGTSRPGGNGGNTIFLNQTAAGGGGGGRSSGSGDYDPSYRIGGTGNGNGGNGIYRTNSATSGSAGTGSYYSSFTSTAPYGGGGGGGARGYAQSGDIPASGHKDGGFPNGGKGGVGGNSVPNTSESAESGKRPGGGGGGSFRENDYDNPYAGSGGAGIATFRIYY